MSGTYDIIVAGAGPVGLIAALKLARADLKVVVVDQLPSVSTAPRALGYNWPSPLVLQEIGVLDDAIAEGVTAWEWEFRNTVTGQCDRMTMNVIPPDEKGRKAFSVLLGQDALANIIVRHLEPLDNAEVRWNHKVIGVDQNDDRVIVTVQTAGGRNEQIRGAWLIGADGSHSAVRKLLGLGFEGHTWRERFVAANVRYDFDAFDFAPATFLRHPVDWAFVIKINRKGLWRITYGEDAGLPREGVADRSPEHFCRILPDPGLPFEVVAINSYQVHERCAPSFRVGRVLLAGDAAHINNPSGGYGLLGGIYDANALALSLIAIYEGVRDESVLDEYAKERRDIFLEVTSPRATTYKNGMMDPDSIEHFDHFAAKAVKDPDVMRALVSAPADIVGTFPVGPGSRLT
jgi:2-polyprenyl-6-methoxyphenol hydroxylase-like FAD-dependent oxidoreductase